MHYTGRKYPLDFAEGCLPDPVWPAPWRGSAEARDFRFLNVDGGLINNEPFEYARFTLMDDPPNRNKRLGHQADRAVLMVDPFPEPPTFLGEDRPPPDLVSVIKALLPALKNQTRFKPSELLLAANEQIYSRFLVAPHRSFRRADAQGREVEFDERYAMASGLLGGFGGFLDEAFRAHDFQLGRRNCQRFLRTRFTLPGINPIVQGWDQRARDDNRFKTTKGGEVEHVIIPLLGSAADPVPLPPWPRMSKADLDELLVRMERRFDDVVPLLRNSQTPSRTLRLALWTVTRIGKPRVLAYLRDAVLADLVRRDQIQGWELPPSLQRNGTWGDARAVLAELANPAYDLRSVPGIAASAALDPAFVEVVIATCMDAVGHPCEVWRSHLRRNGHGPLYCLSSRSHRGSGDNGEPVHWASSSVGPRLTRAAPGRGFSPSWDGAGQREIHISSSPGLMDVFCAAATRRGKEMFRCTSKASSSAAGRSAASR